MKKVLKMMAIAAIASLAFVACNNNKAAEEEVDSTAIEMVVEDEMIAEPAEVLDTTPVVKEEPAAKKAVKPAAKKTDKNTVKAAETTAPSTSQSLESVKKTSETATPQTAPLKRTR
jgi:hypothetical protein